jgi:multiple sugar transport system permease protein
MIMNRDFKGRGLVRAAILVPWAIPTAVTAKLWFFIFAYDGIANKLLGVVGINPQLWTSDPMAAKFAIIIADVWKTTPFMALLILAGLQLVPGDVYEAAQIDGASKVQTFLRITLPLVKTPLMVAVLFRTLDVLRIYDLPAILTQGAGGTTSLSMLVINQKKEGFHGASALSTIVFLIIALTAFLFIRFGGADVIQRPPKSKKAKDPDANTGGAVAANATTTGA